MKGSSGVSSWGLSENMMVLPESAYIPVTSEVLTDVGIRGAEAGQALNRLLRWSLYDVGNPWPSKGFSPHLVDARTRVRAMRYDEDVCDKCGCDGSCR